jgi:uncharacterized protein YegL
MTCIEYSLLEFHNISLHESVKNIINDEESFGILKIKMPKVNITTKKMMIFFNIDATSSMLEHDDRSSPKLEIVKHSLTNIIKYLSKQNVPIYITLQSFNDNVHIIIDAAQITEINVHDTIDKINSIQADGPTNIELALKNAKDFINKYRLENPDHQIAHIFMTDGHPTTGSNNSEILNQLVKDIDCGNVFIGFGRDHNLSLLKKLSENKNSYYQYINNFEDTSCIYGELIHPYLFPCIENVTIQVNNGLIYNWKTNTWTDKLYEDILVSETEKLYHIRKTDEEFDVVVDIYGIDSSQENQQYGIIEKIYELPDLLNLDTNEIEKVDLTPYMFRQKTQELLFKCTQDLESLDYEMKKEFRSLFDQILSYMKETNKLEDPFLKQLCDDLCITYKSVKTYEFGMTSMSRYTSQGRQQTNIYTPKPRENIFNYDYSQQVNSKNNFVGRSINCDFTTLRIRNAQSRNTNHAFDAFDVMGDLPELELELQQNKSYSIDTYEVSQRSTSCYENPSVLETMTQIENS